MRVEGVSGRISCHPSSPGFAGETGGRISQNRVGGPRPLVWRWRWRVPGRGRGERRTRGVGVRSELDVAEWTVRCEVCRPLWTRPRWGLDDDGAPDT